VGPFGPSVRAVRPWRGPTGGSRGSTPHRQAGDSAGSSRNQAGADPQVALGAGRMDEVRPLRVRAARWDSLHVRRSDGPPMAGQVEGRLSGEPPHKSKTNSFFGPPPFLCASTVGPGGRAAQWIIPGAKKSTQHHGRWVAQPDGN